ncbi:MAG TPA: GGDEF domain-containing protein [Methylophilaceae bacterium]|nr:GGDEF domain-containing protein [Methylophilaceae bacterium]
MNSAAKTTNFDPHALAREQLKHIYFYRNRAFLLKAILGLMAAVVLAVQLHYLVALGWFVALLATGAWHWQMGGMGWQDVELRANHSNIHRHIMAAGISGLGWGTLAAALVWLPRTGQDALLVLMVVAITSTMPRLVVLPPFFVAFSAGVLGPLVLALPFLQSEMRQVVLLLLAVLAISLWFTGKEMRRVLADILLKQISFENASWEDRLTGLANRRRFDERLAESWHQAIRLQVPLSLIMLDVDHFKRYNDHYGHQAGDTCLQRVAAALSSRVKRAGDLLARYGGEEFAIVLFHTSMNDGRVVSESVREAVAGMELKHEQSANGIVTVSLGGATIIPTKDAKVEDLVRSADMALYRAKELGRNRVEWNMMPAGNSNQEQELQPQAL